MIGDCSSCGHSLAYHLPLAGCVKCDCDEFHAHREPVSLTHGWRHDLIGSCCVLILTAPLSAGTFAAMQACRPPSTPTPAEAASEVQYVVELQACLDKGKAEHSRAVYRECAAGVDARYTDGGGR